MDMTKNTFFQWSSGILAIIFVLCMLKLLTYKDTEPDVVMSDAVSKEYELLMNKYRQTGPSKEILTRLQSLDAGLQRTGYTSSVEELIITWTLGEQLLYFEPAAGLEKLIDLYQDQKFPEIQRIITLIKILEYVNQQVFDTETINEVAEVLKPLSHFHPIGTGSNRADVITFTYEGFVYILNRTREPSINSERLKIVAKSFILRTQTENHLQLVTHSGRDYTDLNDEHQLVKEQLKLHEQLQKLESLIISTSADEVEYPDYQYEFVVGLMNLLSSHEKLLEVSSGNLDDMLRINRELRNYADSHPKPHFLKGELLVTSDLLLVCALLKEPTKENQDEAVYFLKQAGEYHSRMVHGFENFWYTNEIETSRCKQRYGVIMSMLDEKSGKLLQTLDLVE